MGGLERGQGSGPVAGGVDHVEACNLLRVQGEACAEGIVLGSREMKGSFRAGTVLTTLSPAPPGISKQPCSTTRP